ncbi:hypothetical protein CIPAW_02G114900 [Carya illinoinensis]|uniref:Uncharacterized protein n=1 Tax=Carya illinoinensis TaxID=32201 RepID=A0A8T1RCH2_CARIL|nr:hypothetical protein CIPAW_02G114900 [Carya illinoinensis]
MTYIYTLYSLPLFPRSRVEHKVGSFGRARVREMVLDWCPH